jgi:hypothetical protein
MLRMFYKRAALEELAALRADLEERSTLVKERDALAKERAAFEGT